MAHTLTQLGLHEFSGPWIEKLSLRRDAGSQPAQPWRQDGSPGNSPSQGPGRLRAEAAQSSFSAGKLLTQSPLPCCAKGMSGDDKWEHTDPRLCWGLLALRLGKDRDGQRVMARAQCGHGVTSVWAVTNTCA